MAEAFILMGREIDPPEGKEEESTHIAFPVVETGLLVGMFAYDPAANMIRHAAVRLSGYAELPGSAVASALVATIKKLREDVREAQGAVRTAHPADPPRQPGSSRPAGLWVPGAP